MVEHALEGAVRHLHDEGAVELALLAGDGPVVELPEAHVVAHGGEDIVERLLDEGVLGHVLLELVAQLRVPGLEVALCVDVGRSRRRRVQRQRGRLD